jgi:Rps23 Pro-64 3,4-dihydroxylase Tpa1-like proline 4-hydroxylase
MIEVYDNLISKNYLRDIQNYFIGGNAQWTYMPSMTYGNTEENIQSFGFSIGICDHGNFQNTYPATLLKGLLYQIQEKTNKNQILRSRIDMTVYNPNKYRHEIHIDLPKEIDNITTIFYLNDSDGNTLLYDLNDNVLQEVEPVENRLLVFSGDIPHTGHSPSKNKSRVLINTNYI